MAKKSLTGGVSGKKSLRQVGFMVKKSQVGSNLFFYG